MFLISYYYELMIKMKGFIVVYYYYNQYVINRYFFKMCAIGDTENLGYFWGGFDKYMLATNPTKYHFTQQIFNFFHIFLFQLRLVFLAESFLFILLRMFILYLLIFNKLFFIAAITSLIGIFSRILFHMTFWDMTSVKMLYEYLNWEPLWLLKKNSSDIVLYPTRKNAEILYVLSFLGIMSDEGKFEDAFRHWKMVTVYTNTSSIQKQDLDHFYKFQNLWIKEALEENRPINRLRYTKPYFGYVLTEHEDFIFEYLTNRGIKLNFDLYRIEDHYRYYDEPIPLGDLDFFIDHAPDNFFKKVGSNYTGEINYLMDGTYQKKPNIFFYYIRFNIYVYFRLYRKLFFELCNTNSKFRIWIF